MEKSKATAPANGQVKKSSTTVDDVLKQVSEKPKLSPLNERLGKISNLHKQIQQLEKLNDTARTLDNFNFGSDRLVDSLNLEDGNGNEFTTSNTFLLQKVNDVLKVEVDRKISELQNDILKASI